MHVVYVTKKNGRLVSLSRPVRSMIQFWCVHDFIRDLETNSKHVSLLHHCYLISIKTSTSKFLFFFYQL